VHRLAALSLLALASLAVGCGAERPPEQDSFLPANAAFKTLDYPRVGLALGVPEVARVEPARPPGVVRASLADWFVSAFAYPRREQLPRTPAALDAAERRLVREVRRRHRRLRLVRSRPTRVSGAPALELVADQTLSRTRLRTLSLHVYKGSAEYVVEMVAPVAKFARLERRTFRRVVRSVKVTGSA
jgi:hypothetical protein